MKNQAAETAKLLEGTAYFVQAATLKNEADRLLDGILRKQNEYHASPEEHIVTYRENLENLKAAESNIEALKVLAAEVSGKSGVMGSLFGVSTTMTWAIIIMIVVGIGSLMILLYTLLMRHRALEEYVAPGKKLKAPPVVNLKKQTTRIKGGLITYFLPPFGKPKVDLKQLIKMIKILIAAGILIALILLGMYFMGTKENKTLEITVSDPTASEQKNIPAAEEYEENIFSETGNNTSDEPNEINNSDLENFEETDLTAAEEKLEEEIETEKEATKLKIAETGVGWLNVRLEPSLDGKILTQVNVGEEFEYTDKRDGWYKIILDDETGGWVFGEYVEIIESGIWNLENMKNYE